MASKFAFQILAQLRSERLPTVPGSHEEDSAMTEPRIRLVPGTSTSCNVGYGDQDLRLEETVSPPSSCLLKNKQQKSPGSKDSSKGPWVMIACDICKLFMYILTVIVFRNISTELNWRRILGFGLINVYVLPWKIPKIWTKFETLMYVYLNFRVGLRSENGSGLF